MNLINYTGLISRTIDIMLCGWIWRKYDITISSMTGLEMRHVHPKRWAILLSKILDKIERNHCELAIQHDIQRAKQALFALTETRGP